MRIVRFQQGASVGYGVLRGDVVFSLEGDVFGEFAVGQELCGIGEVKLLAPVQPRIVVGVGSNYYRFLREGNRDLPREPQVFLKPASAVVGPMDNIIYPPMPNDVTFEGELAVVIGREARHVAEERALDYVLGYTCGNDLTAQGLPDRNSTRAKSFYTFCPIGPCLATGIDGLNLRVKSGLNGVAIQDDLTSDMVFGVPRLISFITRFMALGPGDLILTGSSRPGTKISVGDLVEVEIEGIGVLQNTVAKGE